MEGEKKPKKRGRKPKNILPESKKKTTHGITENLIIRLKKNVVDEYNISSYNKDESQNQTINNRNLDKSIDLENKYRGVINGKEDQNIETGSILGKGSEKITCLNCVKPKYPEIAIQRGYEGILKLKVTIQKNGSVKDVLITQSTGYKILDRAGIKAAQESKFYPLSKQSKLNIVYDLKLN